MKSNPHQLLTMHIKARGLPEPTHEYRFAPPRRWRWDLCWPTMMIAVEAHGGVFIQGRHNKGQGFTLDREKVNAGTEAGWKVFEYTTAMVESGDAIKQIERVLRCRL